METMEPRRWHSGHEMGLGAGMEPVCFLMLRTTAATAAAACTQTDASSTHVPALISPTGCTPKGQNSRMLAGQIDAMVQLGVLVLALDTEIAEWSLQVASTSGTAACSVATGGPRGIKGPEGTRPGGIHAKVRAYRRLAGLVKVGPCCDFRHSRDNVLLYRSNARTTRAHAHTTVHTVTHSLTLSLPYGTNGTLVLSLLGNYRCCASYHVYLLVRTRYLRA